MVLVNRTDERALNATTELYSYCPFARGASVSSLGLLWSSGRMAGKNNTSCGEGWKKNEISNESGLYFYNLAAAKWKVGISQFNRKKDRLIRENKIVLNNTTNFL